MSTVRMRLAATALLPLLVGCASISRPPTTLATLDTDAGVARTAERATRDSVIEGLVRRAQRRQDGTLDVLMLSGGGQNGAFGVGFLRGWHSRPNDPMPRFDLITGISTGALQAPYALLGTSASLDTISAIYSRAATEIAPTIDWLAVLKLRKSGGLVNTARFDRALATAIDGPFRDQLRSAFADDRQLLFGTTDFDLGVGRTWSLGQTLDSSEAGMSRVRQLLKAATAIPGIFPPVMVDGHVHADGGVAANVLTLLTFEDYERLAQRLRAAGLTNVTVRAWVVMNMWSHAEPKIISPSSRKQMNARSNMLLFYMHQPETLSAMADLGRAVTAGVPGLRLEVRVATVPAWLALEPGASDLFDKAFMQRLDALGFEKGRSTSPWDIIPSAFARPERVPPR